MNFRNLRVLQCPDCGCTEVVSEKVKHDNDCIDQHSNGQRWESRGFLCGYTVDWIPNYSREFDGSECKRTPKYKEFLRKQQEAKIALQAFIDVLDVDADWKGRISIPYVL